MVIVQHQYQIEETCKSMWKKMVKGKIEEDIDKVLQQQTNEKTKLRFLRGKTFGKEEYLDKVTSNQCRTIMEIRLNMVDVKMNFKGQYDDTICVGCFQTDETTEHFFECPKYQELTGHKLSLGENHELINSTDWLINAAEQLELLQQTRQYID